MCYLWPKIGFLPTDDNDPENTQIAEYFLYEFIMNHSESIEELDLTEFKKAFMSKEEKEATGLEQKDKKIVV